MGERRGVSPPCIEKRQRDFPVNILAVDIGGTNVKMLATGHEERRRFPSGRELTPEAMVEGVKHATRDWNYEAVSIGFPGPVLCGQPMTEPKNLGPGWMGFDFEGAFGMPVKVINDAAMQALGSYEGGKMLFIGLGTGFGATVIWNSEIEPLELGRFQYRKSTLEHYVGAAALKRLGRKKWQRHVEDALAKLVAALKPTDVVIGGGNVKKLKPLPNGTRLGDNSFAFLGGYRLWQKDKEFTASSPPTSNNEPQRAAEGPRPRQHVER
jgi:predicted NBD/HSP70 family sugar kinase